MVGQSWKANGATPHQGVATELERTQCKEKVHEARLLSAADGSGEFKYVVRGQPGKMKWYLSETGNGRNWTWLYKNMVY